jgi:hypothetical protein
MQETGICCIIGNILVGGICIFPLFTLRYACYQKTLADIRVLLNDIYFILSKVFSKCPNLENITITISDALFNA